MKIRHLLLFVVVLFNGSPTNAQDDDHTAFDRVLKEVRRYDAPEARQAVAVDDSHFYAISNAIIGKYDRETGTRIAVWKSSSERPLRHLNSGIVHDGNLYCAHSNYPQWPETSSIEVWDTETMTHVSSQSLGICHEGSLTWIQPIEDGWYAVFANYSKKVNDDPLAKSHRSTQLVRYDDQWRRKSGWVFPQAVLDRFNPHSCSGGSWGPDGKLYCTGHDLGEVYQLAFPKAGSTLILTQTIGASVTGQGIAFDDKFLWGIDRPKGQVVCCNFGSIESEESDSEEVLITAAVETEAVSAGVDEDAADDPALWYNYDDPEKSLVIGSDKKSGVNIYDLQGKRLRSYDVGKINNIDVRQGVFDSVDLVGASNRSTLAMDFWLVEKDAGTLKAIGSIPSKLGDIYGFCLATNIASGQVYAFANSKTGKVEQWNLALTEKGIEGELVRQLQLPSQVEGMVADDELGRLYVGVEEQGVYRFELYGNGSTKGTLIEESGESNSRIKYDIEGLTILKQPNGQGYLIASIQGNSTFAVFERNGNNAYVNSFEIVDGNVDGVQETDGIQVTNLPLGPNFPHGIFICQDGINVNKEKKTPQNFKYVSWKLIAEKLGLK